MTNSKHHTLNYIYIKFEDSKGIIRSHNPRRRDLQWPIEKGQKDKQNATKHYTEN
jgi:hypothetical protein